MSSRFKSDDKYETCLVKNKNLANNKPLTSLMSVLTLIFFFVVERINYSFVHLSCLNIDSSVLFPKLF